MTNTDAKLDDLPSGDEPQDNLQRMYSDTTRVARARRHLDDLARVGEPFSLVAIDLDRSTVVRRRGVLEKRELVRQMHELLRAELPAGAVFLDSGSRDEGWIVLPDDLEVAADLAERLRLHIRTHQFVLLDGTPVSLTASFGVIRAPSHGRTGVDLLWAAGEALWQAKRDRDAVHVASEPIPVSRYEAVVTVDQERALDGIARRTGRSRDSLVHEALQLLLENHAPRWHWIVERGGPTAGASPEHEVPQR
jgi:diguanylate cyclase (GGDEF)-like protein